MSLMDYTLKIICQCHAILHTAKIYISFYPLLPNSSFHFSNAINPSLLTLGLTFFKLVTKSSNPIGRISSRFVVNNASPNDRNGPIAASFVNAVISDPENPTNQLSFLIGGTCCHSDELFELFVG